jgi:hypothetical protein
MFGSQHLTCSCQCLVVIKSRLCFGLLTPQVLLEKLGIKSLKSNDIKVCKSPRIKNVPIHSQWLSLFVVHNKTQHYFKKDETTSSPCSTFEKDIDEGHD